ncbi:Oidioi.mRNA.OKI2018_I69.chr2.g6877.t1.cds [Oikopleura dioica]|uniref:Oidioi.mRNA.OKI2018_I69.chr2.g6877.t1.cds n=1 Tax=Oikopleura dioica TaxID=34765 RepID=A0ABN7T974_OIKDI|nr:Oidioi.mRNA.OKI2018_I69.chr2.g6877.t1.cds [Oikopleura dioica]
MANSNSDNELEMEVIKEARLEKESIVEPQKSVDLKDSDEDSDEQDSDDDEDILTTGTVVKEADILIHPRGGCPIHPFRKTFKEKKVIAKNEKFCEKCFCYICDIEASKCDYWTDAKVRHCNAYHTKDGLWRFIREKYKERKAKKENLLAIKRDLHEQRKRKRPETSKAASVIDLADLEEKMKKLEEVRVQKEKERLKRKEEERQQKIQNQEAFTYQTHEAFEAYESTAPPAAGVTLNDTETLPDFSKTQPAKPKIQMKINFSKSLGQSSEQIDQDDNDGLTDPSAPKKKRPEEKSSEESPEKSIALARVRNASGKSGEYSDLPHTAVALPEDQLKPAGSGLSNSSLSHLQQWLASTKHNANLELKKAQENLKAIEAPGRSTAHFKSSAVFDSREFMMRRKTQAKRMSQKVSYVDSI